MFSISPLRNSTLVKAALALVLFGKREHFVGHVEPVGFACRADAASGKQHVNAAAGAKIEDGFTMLQFGKGRGVTAAQRGVDRRVG